MPVDRRRVKLDLDRKWSACAWTKWSERAAICLREAGLVVGGWYGQFHVAGGSLVVLAVSNCPFCGVPLWGRPGVAA